jgi:antitoxin YqcF
MYKNEKEYPVRLEIVGVCQKNVKWFANLIATLAFYIIKQKLVYHPGFVFLDIGNLYDFKSDLKHIYFSDPFLWDDLDPLQMETKKVAWLLIIPISDGEYKYLIEHGEDKFEELLEKSEANVFDLIRASIV